MTFNYIAFISDFNIDLGLYDCKRRKYLLDLGLCFIFKIGDENETKTDTNTI